MKKEFDWIDLGAEAPHEIIPGGELLAPDEIDELVTLAIDMVRKRETPFDDLWLGLKRRGRQHAVHLFALKDNVTCVIDIHPMSRGVALADHLLAEGIRIPWACLGKPA